MIKLVKRSDYLPVLLDQMLANQLFHSMTIYIANDIGTRFSFTLKMSCLNLKQIFMMTKSQVYNIHLFMWTHFPIYQLILVTHTVLKGQEAATIDIHSLIKS
jgi:hypothetical protein